MKDKTDMFITFGEHYYKVYEETGQKWFKTFCIMFMAPILITLTTIIIGGSLLSAMVEFFKVARGLFT